MIHISLFLNFCALLMGIGAIFTTLIIYLQEKRTAILAYSLCLSAIFFMLLGTTLRVYFEFNSLLDREYLYFLYFIFAKGGLVFSIFIIPLFTELFFAKKITALKLTCIIAYTFIASILALIKFLIKESIFFVTILQIQLFGVFIYMIINGLISFKRIKSPIQKKIFFIFTTIAILFIPALTPLHFLTPYFFAFFYLILSITSIIFCFIFFKRIPFYIQFSISNDIIKKYNITSRESEIIDLIIKGLTNREIGKKLYISEKTVKNHITNIYQKTNIKNRLQLFNLLNSGSK